jgi:signal transduction histidine kinase
MQGFTNSTAKSIRDWKLSVFWIVVLSGMASLLIIVAVLQYRWTKQLSVAAEAGIGSNLQPLMIGWHVDFYGELSAICIALQVGPDSGALENWDDYLRRYVDWTQAGAVQNSVENIHTYPDLIENIYIWQTSGRSAPRLFRFNAQAESIDGAELPADLQPLLSRLQQKSSSLSVGLHAWEFQQVSTEQLSSRVGQVSTATSSRADKMTGWQFDKNVVAIVHPIVSRDHGTRKAGMGSHNGQNPVDWIVVVLNRDYIKRKILPDLTKRYFSGPDGLEYKLALVAKGQNEGLLYTTDPDFPGGGHIQVDSQMNIFGPPPESVEGHFWESIKNSESLRRQEWRSFSAPVWFPVIQYVAQNEPWMLMVQHRTGPLEAVAARIWRRNLLTGGVVLLLLTVDMGLILFASRRAQKLAKLQLQFVASISHELLTPLTVIFGAARNAMDGLVETKADMKIHGSIIASQASQLIDLVKQNLSFAASESRPSRYTLRPLEVSEILESVNKNVAMLIEENGFRVEQEIPERLPKVMGDLSAICHCLQNLIVNAVKYSGKNGWIGITASVHSAESGVREVRITVADHGPGISSSELRHIFKPFYRSPKVVDAQIRGTGLGLAVAERIAKDLGGSLSVTSQVGVGSAFALDLPAERQADAGRWESCPESTEAYKR